MTVRKARLGDPEVDPTPVFGAEAVSLVHRLTRMSYSLAGHPLPVRARAEIRCRFVRGVDMIEQDLADLKILERIAASDRRSPR